MIRAIVALDERRGIAADGRMPWHIPEDLQYFRRHTEGSIVVMGRATYDTLARPLPDRRNVVASRNLQSVREGFELINDVHEFLMNADADVWVIGGSEIYQAALPYVEQLYITQIRGDFDCDRFFPQYESAFRERSSSPWHVSGDYTYRFIVCDPKEKPVSP